MPFLSAPSFRPFFPPHALSTLRELLIWDLKSGVRYMRTTKHSLMPREAVTPRRLGGPDICPDRKSISYILMLILALHRIARRASQCSNLSFKPAFTILSFTIGERILAGTGSNRAFYRQWQVIFIRCALRFFNQDSYHRNSSQARSTQALPLPGTSLLEMQISGQPLHNWAVQSKRECRTSILQMCQMPG